MATSIPANDDFKLTDIRFQTLGLIGTGIAPRNEQFHSLATNDKWNLLYLNYSLLSWCGKRTITAATGKLLVGGVVFMHDYVEEWIVIIHWGDSDASDPLTVNIMQGSPWFAFHTYVCPFTSSMASSTFAFTGTFTEGFDGVGAQISGTGSIESIHIYEAAATSLP